MLPVAFVVFVQCGDLGSGFGERRKQRLVEALIPEAAVEALDEAVLHRLAVLHLLLVGTRLLTPSENGHAGQFGSDIGDQHATQTDQRIKFTRDLRAGQLSISYKRQAFAAVIVHYRQNPGTTAVGSRYFLAAVCEGLDKVEAAPAPCKVIGKPVEIAATRNAMALFPALKEKVGVTLSFFCAETSPTLANRKLMEKFDVQERNLLALRYIGYGWPGYFTTQYAGEEPRQHRIYHRS